jgi:hypothetical protein
MQITAMTTLNALAMWVAWGRIQESQLFGECQSVNRGTRWQVLTQSGPILT